MIYLPLGTYGYIYMSINNVTGRKYIGQKKSRRIVEDYFGSGKILRQALAKYGSENFDVTILDIATSKEDLDERKGNGLLNMTLLTVVNSIIFHLVADKV